MLIGIVGGALSVTDDRLKIGVYKVTRRFLENIRMLGYSNNYRVYTFNKIGDWAKDFPGYDITEKLLRPSTGWQKVRLPLELAMNPVDIFLGFSQMIPYSKSYNIGLIYDLGFLSHPQDYSGSAEKLRKNTAYLTAHSNHIITISQTVKKEILLTYGLQSDIVTVCYPGVDEIFTSVGKKIHRKNPYFLYVGALKPGKNIPALIAGFKAFLTLSGKPYDLVLAGGNYWPDPEIDLMINKLGLTGRVIKTGYLTDSDLSWYYRGATGCVQLDAHEGFSLPAAEAMASGIPLVISRCGALPEICADAAISVNPDNPDEIAIALMEILKPDIKKRLVKKGLIRSKKYSWRVFTENVHQVINLFRK